ncbi:MAG: amidohydrolase family protein [Hyphomicrobiaceae bacterium]|nr:amidohydrolase family protein [Hyphomicrobiaceae bacterium]
MTDDELPIIDAHHHFWDPPRTDNPWLVEQPQIAFRYGDYGTICKPFLPADYRALWGHHKVVANVTMEGEWSEADPVGETRWMRTIANKYRSPIAHVARAFLDRGDVEAVLAGHAADPLVRAIRHKPAAALRPDAIEPAAPGGMSDPAWQRGYGLLAQFGLHFELQAPWWHVGELLRLIDRHPETPVVINHAFMPADRSPEALAAWRSALGEAASAPDVAMKISGIGIAGRAWDIEDQRPIIDACIEMFGPERCMFASNFPVDGLVGAFETIYSGFKSATRDLPAADRIRLFHDNAVRFYRLPLAPISE